MKNFLIFFFCAVTLFSRAQLITGPVLTGSYTTNGGGGNFSYLVNNTAGTLYIQIANQETSVVIKTSTGTYSGYGGGGVISYTTNQFSLAPGAYYTLYGQGWSSPNYLLAGSGSFMYGVSTAAYAPVTNSFSYTMSDNSDQAYSISAGSPLTYTNFTFYIENTSTVNCVGTWIFDGSPAKVETLVPGQSDTWTTPQLEVSPVAELYTIQMTIVPVGNSIGQDSDGSSQFVAGGTGGGVSGGATGSGGNLSPIPPTGSGTSGGGGQTVTTNGLSLDSGTNSLVIVGTNVVSWSPPTGAASESTLEAAATLAHADAQNLLSGEQIINNTLSLQTNELGQLIGGVSSNNILAFNADTYLSQIATNTARSATNQNSIVLSNLVLNVTNSSGTNVAMTNYATETTQLGISNLLSRLFTNSAPSNSNYSAAFSQMSGLIPSSATNSDAAEAAAAANDDVSGVTALLNELVPSIPADSANPPNWTINFCGQTVNFDPVANFPMCFNASYIGWSLVLLLVFLYQSAKLYLELVQMRASTSTGGVPDLEVMGGGEAFTFGGSFGGNFIGAALAVLVPTVFIAIFAIPMAWLFSHLGISVSQAMDVSAFTGALGTGYYLLVSGFPLNLAFTLFCTAITLRFTVGKLFQLATSAARYLFGK